jgi:hypothetical protein
MDDQQRLEALRAELASRGLSRAYIERLVAELDDHIADLANHLLNPASHLERNLDMSAARKPGYSVDNLGERIGTPTQLAIFAAEQYRARSFLGRHPILTFVMAPLPVFAALCLTYYLVVALPILAFVYLAEHVLGWPFAIEKHPWFGCGVLTFFSCDLVVLAPITTAWLLSRLAIRNAVNWRWPTVACALLAAVVAMVRFSWNLHPGPHQNGVFTIGFNVGSSAQWILLDWLPKFGLALAIGLALVWRARRPGDAQNSDGPATISTLPAA